jgi:S-adenosylmethionine/arginine decarboxylase-like enzyme
MDFNTYVNQLLPLNEAKSDKIIHYHMILRLKVNNPVTGVKECNTVIEELVDAIDMKILSGPHTKYLDVPGNRGITSVTIIETSHISLHVWDEQDPALIQLDIFSCKKFTKEQVLKFLKNRFDITDLEFIFLDRTNGLKVR